MAQRLVEDCGRVDGDREFLWALSVTTFEWMRFLSFGVLKLVLLVMVFFTDSTTFSVLAAFGFLVAMIAEEASADRVVIAAVDTEMVVFDAAPGLPHVRPTVVSQRLGRSDVHRTSMGLFGERWDLGSRSVQIASWHRSKIRKWVNEYPYSNVIN